MQGAQPPIHLNVAVSRQLAAWIVSSHAVMLALVFCIPNLHNAAKIGLAVFILASALYYWRRFMQRQHAKAVHAAVFYAIDEWRIHTSTGSYFASLQPSSFIHPWLCVLHWRTDSGKAYTLILLPDSVDRDVLRRLRVRLKFS